jgi:hypothetical protein
MLHASQKSYLTFSNLAYNLKSQTEQNTQEEQGDSNETNERNKRTRRAIGIGVLAVAGVGGTIAAIKWGVPALRGDASPIMEFGPPKPQASNPENEAITYPLIINPLTSVNEVVPEISTFSVDTAWTEGSPTAWSWAQDLGIPEQRIPEFLTEVMGEDWAEQARQMQIGDSINADKETIAKYILGQN